LILIAGIKKEKQFDKASSAISGMRLFLFTSIMRNISKLSGKLLQVPGLILEMIVVTSGIIL